MSNKKHSLDMAEYLRTRLLCRTNQFLSREAFERRRLRRFREFAGYVKNHSPYYRRVMEEHRIDPAVCTPEQFPVLTKTELILNFEDILTVRGISTRDVTEFLHKSTTPEELFRDRYVVIHTSGSSGEIALFLYDPKAWARAMAHLSRAKGFTLFSRRRKKIGFIGATQGHFAGVTTASAVKSFPLSPLCATAISLARSR